MSSRVFESTIIDAPLEVVWDLVRPVTFTYNPAVKSAVPEGKTQLNEVGGQRIISYKDGTVQHVRLNELSDARYTVAWEIVFSEPAHHVLGAAYKVGLRRVTKDNLTFIEWVVDFSKDATPAVLADAKFKAQENFKALAATAKAKIVANAAEKKVGKAGVTLPVLKRQLSAKSQLLANLFATADKNKNGVLEFDEFALVVNKLYGENLDDEAIKALLRDADSNHDGVVNLEEFQKWLAQEGLEAKAALEEKRIEELTKAGYKLTYFPLKGRAELARLLFHDAGVPFVDDRINPANWGALKSTTPFGQLPVLEFGNKKLAQSHTIARYVAKVCNLYGDSVEEAAQIDSVVESVKDAIAPFVMAFGIKNEEEKKTKVAEFFANHLPNWVGLLEKALTSNKGSPYFVGKRASLADFALFSVSEPLLSVNPQCLNAAPALLNLITKIKSRPNIAKYLAARPVTPY